MPLPWWETFCWGWSWHILCKCVNAWMHIYALCMWAWCLHDLHEDIWSPRTEVMVVVSFCAGAGNQIKFFMEPQVLLTKVLSLQSASNITIKRHRVDGCIVFHRFKIFFHRFSLYVLIDSELKCKIIFWDLVMIESI